MILTPPTLSPTWRNESAIHTFAGSTPWPIGRQTRDSASSPRSGQNPKDKLGTGDNRSKEDATSPLHKEATPWTLTSQKPQKSTLPAPISGRTTNASIARSQDIMRRTVAKETFLFWQPPP